MSLFRLGLVFARVCTTMDLLGEERQGAVPPGARLRRDLIDVDEEAALLAFLDAGDWSTELQRRVQHFGYRYDYKAGRVTADSYLGPLPPPVSRMAGRLVRAGLMSGMPDQAIANEYRPGQGISAHVDCVPCFGDAIVSVSLLSSCEMVFRQRATAERMAVILPARSALLLTGPARYDWTHEIPARKSDRQGGIRIERSRRVSLTFRTMVTG